MTANQVALIDWDESHIDVPDLDPVLPDNAAGLDIGGRLRTSAVGSTPWRHRRCGGGCEVLISGSQAPGGEAVAIEPPARS